MKIETRRKCIKSFWRISIVAYIIAFLIKIIGGYLKIEQDIVMNVFFLFIAIGALSSGAVGIFMSGFSLRQLIHDLSPKEIARRRRRRKELREKRKSQMYTIKKKRKKRK